ncbi:hypothetical protein GCM10010339_43440 [Streptomyces alanosinicus]|uniref:Uncharacterized protein n=1 Tax=Streptomyces alanosinicus TaxID=68171 RepID=A0A918YK04_9ACTN|nr:hypothetical protein GCM10010339_43440 [Streptomyces alanosinicus]
MRQTCCEYPHSGTVVSVPGESRPDRTGPAGVDSGPSGEVTVVGSGEPADRPGQPGVRLVDGVHRGARLDEPGAWAGRTAQLRAVAGGPDGAVPQGARGTARPATTDPRPAAVRHA